MKTVVTEKFVREQLCFDKNGGGISFEKYLIDIIISRIFCRKCRAEDGW